MTSGRLPGPTRLSSVMTDDGDADGQVVAIGHNSGAMPAPAIIADDELALECWEWVTSNMRRLGYLEAIDRDLVLLYSQIMSRTMRAYKGIAEHGDIVISPNGYPMPSPWIAIYNKGVEQLNRMGLQFGWSPVGRSRIDNDQLALPMDDGEGDDKFEKFLLSTAR